MDEYQKDDCWPTFAQFFANSLDIRRLEEDLRDVGCFHELLALSHKLAVCRGRAAAYKFTLRTATTIYRGYAIRASFKHGYMVMGKHYLGFANDLRDAKRIIDDRLMESETD